MSKAKNLYACDKCGFTSDRNFNLIRHTRIHRNGKSNRKLISGNNCSLCKEKGLSKADILHHYKSDHGIAIETKHLKFENLEEFRRWKIDFEKRTTSSFRKITGTKKCEDRYFEYYQCHRNGVYKSNSTGKRKTKLQNSNMIGGFCPATISAAYVDPLKTVEVTYIPTHVGHQNDISRVNLTLEQKIMLAEKIKSSVPLEQILAEAWVDLDRQGTERTHLLKKRDIHNIKKTFKLSRGVPREDCFVNVDLWAKDRKNTGLVRFYKPRGQHSSTFPALHSDEFVLVIANDVQLDLLRQYGKDCVCFDGSRSVHDYDFELTSILVLDELHQAIPCALMFTRNSNRDSLSAIISVLVNILKDPICPKVLITGMSVEYSNAWNAAMIPAPHVLYSVDQVAENWKKNLSKVKGLQKRKKVSLILQNLLQEKSVDVFSDLLSTTLAKFETDQELSVFGRYFKAEFLDNVHRWAYCHRAHLISDNIKINNFQQVLKYMNRECKKAKKLDVAIHSVMNFIHVKLYKRLTSDQNCTQNSDVANMENRHQEAVELAGGILENTDSGWVFAKSVASSHKYEILRNNIKCNCESKCKQCGACIHLLRCTCHDSAIHWNVCKHIHYVMMNGWQPSKKETNSAVAEKAVVPDTISLSTETIPFPAEIMSFATETALHNAEKALIPAHTMPLAATAIQPDDQTAPPSSDRVHSTAETVPLNAEPSPLAAETSFAAVVSSVLEDEASAADMFFDIFSNETPGILHPVSVPALSNEQNSLWELEHNKRHLMALFNDVVESSVETMEHVRICENGISTIRTTIEAFNGTLGSTEAAPASSILWLEN